MQDQTVDDNELNAMIAKLKNSENGGMVDAAEPADLTATGTAKPATPASPNGAPANSATVIPGEKIVRPPTGGTGVTPTAPLSTTPAPAEPPTVVDPTSLTAMPPATPTSDAKSDDTNATGSVTSPGPKPDPKPVSDQAAAINPQLDEVKRAAISELRPLVDKLDLSPEDKFDTLLLIIRSTDDSSLLSQAHEAAKQIPDETRRAQALLDIIKEIDFFGQNSVK